MTSEPLLLFCPVCDREELAETPPCTDGHGELCSDRACVECGSAVLFDAQLIQLAIPSGRQRRHDRRAA